MLVQAYGAAFAIIVGSVVLGRAICTLCGGPRRWSAAPIVGLAALMIIAFTAIKLPGRAVTAAVVCGVLVLVAAAYLAARARPRFPLGDVAVGGLALLGASIPFAANGRVGLQGPPWDNDSATHLLIAESLRSPRMAKLWPAPPGYPLGPHSIVTTIGTALDVPLDMALAGLLLATVVLIAITAADVLADEALWRRAVVGVLSALTYLVASYYGEGSFKEPIMAGLLLGFVLHLEQVRARWSEARPAVRARMVIPAGLMGAGAIYTYSYLGIVWFAGTLAVWTVLEAAARPALARGWISWRRASAAAPWIAGLALLGVIVLLPIASLVRSTFQNFGVSPATTSSFAPNDLGNLPGPLSFFEALGIWTSQDFRYAADNFHHGEGAVFALGVVVVGLLVSLRRRQLVLASAAIACGLIYVYTEHTQSAYVAAKALVIGAPVFMALGLRALLAREERDRATNAVVLAVAALFSGLAGYSTYLTLQTEPVQAPETGRELAAFHRRIGNSKVLFLGIDDFAAWQLRQSQVYALGSSYAVSANGVYVNARKPFNGLALDFDSVTPTDLDRFTYVITTNTPYASQAPANFHPVALGRLYELWERKGPTPPFQALDPSGQPGKILDCSSPRDRRLSEKRGIASVMATPVVAPGASLSAGQSGKMYLALPQGRWELSAEYLSYFNLHFSAEGGHWRMPAYLGRNGPWFAVGEITGHGFLHPVTIRATAERPSFLTGSRVTAVSIYQIAATRVPDTREILPLRDACGTYVDWYRLS
ncbi:MAG TPA: hypothetical protein VG275_14345 [Solirubrobacteraceae bacterium]|nr:hypothetical protein [Solirubrobacteraceae bacterium]